MFVRLCGQLSLNVSVFDAVAGSDAGEKWRLSMAKNDLIVIEFCYFLYLCSEASDVTSSIENTQGNTPLLFTPMTIGGLHIRNRIIASPMCQ